MIALTVTGLTASETGKRIHCQRCNMPFVAQRSTRKFCSDACRMGSMRTRRKVKSVTVNLEVRELFDPKQWKPFLLKRHYARRLVGARRAFGLFDNGKLVGCCLFSIPASYTLCKGVCGPDYKPFVLELSRLTTPRRMPNAASFLVGRALRLLGDHVVVSYADAGVGHVGAIYQATNWLYTGLSSGEFTYRHPATGAVIARTRRHIDEKAKALGLTEQQLIRERMVKKHRYVCFTGSKAFRRKAVEALAYAIQPYPKGKSKRHRLRPLSTLAIASTNKDTP